MRKSRLVGLDCFRVAAALVTFLFHSVIHMECKYGLLQDFFKMGAISMTGFFMLSGYALYYSHYKNDFSKIDEIKVFYKKRIASVLPAYYAIVFIFLIGYAKEGIIERIILLPIDMLGISSTYSSLFSISHNGGTWFISCILLCYILFPFFIQIIRQLRKKEKFIVYVILIIILLYSPIVVWWFGLASIYSNPFFRTIEFVLGMLLASNYDEFECDGRINRFFLNKKAIFVETIVLILAITIAVRLNISVGNYMLYSWICLPIFSMMFPALQKINLRGNRLLAYASDISYAFFLAQLFVWRIMRWLIDLFVIKNNSVLAFISFIICCILAIAIHELIEKPGKNMFRRVFKI